MLKELVNRIQGQVRLRVEAAFPERVLNLCGARHLSFWDVEWESATVFTCRMGRRDSRVLRQAVREMDCTVTVVGREGAPYFLLRFRRRYVLLAGLCLCAAAMVYGSFFIWDFQVEGNETVPDEEILRALEKNGVGIGTFSFSLDPEGLRNQVLLEIPELSWLTVNVSGCRATVQVRERVQKPEMVDERTPANVVARRAGLVLTIRSVQGVNMVLPGTSVEEGQLLISGVEDTDTVGARILAGRGTVTARTWYTLTTRMPLTAETKSYTGRKKTGWSLVFGTHRVKFYGNSSIEGAEYDKITTRYPWTLLGLRLPVTLVRETYRFYERAETEVDPAAAESAGEAILTEYLHSLVDPYGTVTTTLCTSRQRGDVLEVTLAAECQEEIGRTAPIYVSDDTPDP